VMTILCLAAAALLSLLSVKGAACNSLILRCCCCRRARQTEGPASPPPGALEGAAAAASPAPLSPTAAMLAGLNPLQVKTVSSGDAEAGGSPLWQRSSQAQMDWQLGALPSGAPASAGAAEGGAAGRGAGALGRDGRPAWGSASLYCLLGKLYCAARTELLRLGAAAGLEVPKSAAAAAPAEPHQHSAAGGAAAAGAAAPAADVSQAARPASQAVPLPGSLPAAADDGSAPPALSEAPSTTDMSQVDLNGFSQDPQQQLQQQQQAGEEEAGGAALRLERAPDGSAGPDLLRLSSNIAEGAAAGTAGASPQRLTVRSKAAGGEEGERRLCAGLLGWLEWLCQPCGLKLVGLMLVGLMPCLNYSSRVHVGHCLCPAVSPGSSPRSTSTQQSSQAPVSSDAGHAVAAAAAPAPPATTPQMPVAPPPLAASPQRPEQADMRSVERQVGGGAERPALCLLGL
jgi:hypothetical protein